MDWRPAAGQFSIAGGGKDGVFDKFDKGMFPKMDKLIERRQVRARFESPSELAPNFG